MHPHLKEAREGHESKIRRISGAHGTSRNPSGNSSLDGTKGSFPGGAERAGEEVPEGPQASVGLADIKAEGTSPKRNLGKFARGGKVGKYASGGRTKKGTTVNVMVSPAPAPAPTAAPAMPMPHPPMMAGPPPGGPPPGLPPGAPPPGGPPGMPPGMMHNTGGRAFKRGGKVAPQYPQKVETAHKQDLSAKGKFKAGGRTFDAGSANGEGRLEKIKAYGKKAHMKPQKV